MTRKNDDKRGGPDSGNSHDAKVERRFTKEANAKQQQGGARTGTPPKLNKTHADDGGEHRF